MPDDTEARLVQSPHKSLAQLAQQVHVSRRVMWRETKSLYLWPHKMTWVLVIEESDHERRMHFVTVFCGQYMMVFLRHNLH
jgi:hypothetical protein